MNFQPDLAAKVIAGRKTVTRRLVSDNPNSPWWSVECGLRVGRSYAVCPGRGKPAIGRVLVHRVDLVTLGHIPNHEAIREGFKSTEEFEREFARINKGKYDPDALVLRIGFRVVRDV